MIVEIWCVRIMLKFDYYFFAFVDPVQSLIQTFTLTLLFKSTLIDDLFKFSLARLAGILFKFGFVLVYLLMTNERINFLFMKKIKDDEIEHEYYIHPSNKEFQKQFSYSTIIFFVTNNIERMFQVRLFTMEQLGFFGFMMSIGDNLHNLLTGTFIEFITNFFNYKFNIFWHSNDKVLENEVFAEIKEVYFQSVKYISIFYQMLLLYGSYMLLDKSAFILFGANYGNQVC